MHETTKIVLFFGHIFYHKYFFKLDKFMKILSKFKTINLSFCWSSSKISISFGFAVNSIAMCFRTIPRSTAACFPSQKLLRRRRQLRFWFPFSVKHEMENLLCGRCDIPNKSVGCKVHEKALMSAYLNDQSQQLMLLIQKLRHVFQLASLSVHLWRNKVFVVVENHVQPRCLTELVNFHLIMKFNLKSYHSQCRWTGCRAIFSSSNLEIRVCIWLHSDIRWVRFCQSFPTKSEAAFVPTQCARPLASLIVSIAHCGELTQCRPQPNR